MPDPSVSEIESVEYQVASAIEHRPCGSFSCRDEFPRLVAQEQEKEALREFACEVLSGYRDGCVGDIDGGWLQEKAIELGLLVALDDDGSLFQIAPQFLPPSSPAGQTEK